jgi:hypothetical protein
MSDTATATNPRCPLKITTGCAGPLDYRDDPERFVCSTCCRVWSLTDIAILGQRTAS